ncbi:MAG: LemA family protein [Candidatus Omnitrophica bacterium]|nr:LemA family protein [Candidatus Omnitrophota bacterium]
MDDMQKINQMLADRTITQKQADLLTVAIQESAQRRESVCRRFTGDKQQKISQSRRFIAVWIISAAMFAGGGVLCGMRMSPHIAQPQVIADLTRAAQFINVGEYSLAQELCQDALANAPDMPLGHALLAVAHKMQAEQAGVLGVPAERNAPQRRDVGRERRARMSIANFFTVVFFGMVLGGIGVAIMLLHNTLVRAEEGVNQAWAQIYATCLRKLDLVPALLEAAGAYLEHEKTTLLQVTEARAKALKMLENPLNKKENSAITEAHSAMQQGLAHFTAVVEKYPALLADRHFLTIQKELAETESLICRQRQVYNAQVGAYQAALRSFPCNIVAGLFNFEPKAYYEPEHVTQTVAA